MKLQAVKEQTASRVSVVGEKGFLVPAGSCSPELRGVLLAGVSISLSGDELRFCL